jgi:hypothetical protein
VFPPRSAVPEGSESLTSRRSFHQAPGRGYAAVLASASQVKADGIHRIGPRGVWRGRNGNQKKVVGRDPKDVALLPDLAHLVPDHGLHIPGLGGCPRRPYIRIHVLSSEARQSTAWPVQGQRYHGLGYRVLMLRPFLGFEREGLPDPGAFVRNEPSAGSRHRLAPSETQPADGAFLSGAVPRGIALPLSGARRVLRTHLGCSRSSRSAAQALARRGSGAGR